MGSAQSNLSAHKHIAHIWMHVNTIKMLMWCNVWGFKLILVKTHPKISKRNHQFWKTPKFFKNPKPKFQIMKCMKNKRLETYQEKKILERGLKNPWGRGLEWKGECLGDEQLWTDRERSKKWEKNRDWEIYRPFSNAWQLRYREVSRKLSRIWSSTAKISKRYQATKSQIQEQKLDRSTRCRRAIEEAGAFSIDPPSIDEVSRLHKKKKILKKLDR